jgi:nucleoside-triphosphatase
MGKRILLTGRPGCGKTTLIQRVVNKLGLPAGGFYTEEIRQRGQRVGFKLITLDGKEAVFADINFKTPERLGKYGLDLSKLETVGVAAVRDAVHSRQIVVIDEIGPMEVRSAIFRDAVNEAFESGMPILATIVARSLPFTDAIRKRSDVSVLEVRASNRDELVSKLRDEFESCHPKMKRRISRARRGVV